MPRWRAGIHEGKPVKVSYTVPINFVLQGSSEKGKSNSASKTPAMKNPLIFVNGKKITKDEMNKIPGESIEKVEVLKEESAIEKYGSEANDGVVLITLKASSTDKFKQENLDGVHVVGYSK